ncbi:MAG: hypothetical protein A2X36_15440 [Elusimicrobia bacterium GWA2_69_24]|nr:MAG: hypothetical protein A2X36_15440 [Elusimicrobia bacterium GWA2_69_24]HBL18109.1 hypothetical protein [Elusimicrobiota bacterium]
MTDTPPPAPLPTPPRGRFSRPLAALALFLSGLVCGAGGAALALRRAAQRAVSHPEVRAQRATQWLGKKLDLDAAQREKVGAILQRQAADLEVLRAGVWPRVLERLETTEREIAGTLRPDQRAAWTKLAAGLKRKWLPPPAPAAAP